MYIKFVHKFTFTIRNLVKALLTIYLKSVNQLVVLNLYWLTNLLQSIIKYKSYNTTQCVSNISMWIHSNEIFWDY